MAAWFVVIEYRCPQQPQLVSLQAVDARRAVLGAANVDSRGIEVNLLPANVDQLADPQCVPEGHEDQQPVAPRVAAVAGSGHQAIDLALRQVLALPVIGARLAQLMPLAAHAVVTKRLRVPRTGRETWMTGAALT